MLPFKKNDKLSTNKIYRDCVLELRIWHTSLCTVELVPQTKDRKTEREWSVESGNSLKIKHVNKKEHVKELSFVEVLQLRGQLATTREGQKYSKSTSRLSKSRCIKKWEDSKFYNQWQKPISI